MADYSRRLAVLVLTSDEAWDSKEKTVGKADVSLRGGSELENYVELLSGYNYRFEIITDKQVSDNTFIDKREIRYASVVVTIPFQQLSDKSLYLLKDATCKFGVSIITSYTNADRRSQSFFGIRKFRRKGYLLPLKAKIIKWPLDIYEGKTVVGYGLRSGLTGYRKRGFRKLSFKQTFTKGIRLLYSLLLPYAGVELKESTRILATDMRGEPLAWSYQFGKATNYYFALHGDLFLNKFNEMHRLVRSAIETNSGFGMVSSDLENTMALRLDDPGACSADYLDTGRILEQDDWEELGKLLGKKGIPLSVVYTPGWVDDGDKKSGKLLIDDQEITERRPGTIYDSARVKYIPLGSKDGIYDHSSEFKGLKKLVEEGRIDVHSHGLTHIDPDHDSWVRASDRRKNSAWYNEFFHVPSRRGVNKDRQRKAMVSSREKIKSLFGTDPCVLTPSSHRHSPDCDLLAYNAGYSIFSCDYTGIFKNDMAVRNWKIPSIFLCLKDPSSFASRSGYPVIGVIHDYEIKKVGLGQFEKLIEKWRVNGIKKFISMRELAVSLCILMDVHYLEKESQMEIVLTIPTQMEELVRQINGINLILRFVMPEKMIFLESLLSISGANLISVYQSTHNSTATVFLRLGNESTITISLPMRSVGLEDEQSKGMRMCAKV